MPYTVQLMYSCCQAATSENRLLSVSTTDATHRLLEVEPLNKAVPQMSGIYPVEHKKRQSGANIN